MAIGNIKGCLIAVGLIAIGIGMAPATNAATYYVSADGGDDAYTAIQAQNIDTPWQTIQRAADNMAAGDTCLIRSGTYRETVTVSSSGTSNAPIVFQAYNDEQVSIVGTESITNWTQQSATVYSAPMGWTLGDSNQVFMNEVMLPLAQWPNAGALYPWQNSFTNPSPDWAYVDTAGYDGSGHAWLTDAQLPDRPDGYWNGCILNIMAGYGWRMAIPAVTGYADSTKTLSTDLDYVNPPFELITAGNEYYLTGNIGEMDSPGEWFYDSANGLLYIYLLAPPSAVEAKARSYGFDLAGRSYVQLVNLDFFACTIKTDANSTYCVYDGLYMRYLNHSRKHAASYGLNLWNGNVLRNSELAYDSRGLVSLMGGNIRVINNHMHDSGYVPIHTAMIDCYNIWDCSSNLVSHNTMHDAGRSAIGFPGRASIVEYNDMYNVMKLTADGGIFYSQFYAGNNVVRYNLMHDSYGPQGHLGEAVQGCYLDNFNSGWIVHHNIIWNISGFAMQFNNRQNFNMVFNNTCWGADQWSLIAGFSEYVDGKSGTRIFNNLFMDAPIGYWGATDFHFNLYSDPLFVDPSQGNFNLQANSFAIDQGTPIPGITDGYVGTAPDQGALEYGGTNWTGFCGYQNPPPSPDPVYSYPDMMFCNKVKDGSFERNCFAPYWTTNATCNAATQYGNCWIANPSVRIGLYKLKFGQGTSEVRQTVSGLMTNHAYELYGGLLVTNGASVVKLGVRNFGNSGATVTAPAKSGWAMYSLPFMTGATNTSAEIYISVVTPVGVNSEVSADDLSVEARLLDDGMTLWLKLDETNGTVAADSSWYGHNGALATGSWTTGAIGGAASFDGAVNYLAVSNVAVDTVAGGCNTVCFWMKWNGANGQMPFAWNGANYDLFLYWNSFGFNTFEGNLLGIPATGLANRWVHVAAVFPNAVPSANNVKLYIDGVEQPITVSVGATTATRKAISNVLFSGYSATTNGSYKFNGLIDDARIYNRKLTAAEVTALAARSPLLWLKLDETNGTMAADSSCHGHNGAQVTGSWTTGEIGGAASFDGAVNYLRVNDVGVDTTSGGCNTVWFWMKWNGSAGHQIPFAWEGRYYSLFFWSGGTSFGFNTGEGNILGISAAGLSNRWVHVAAVFPNAVPSAANAKLYIDGVAQTLTVRQGAAPARTCVAAPNVLLAASSATTNTAYKFNGLIDDARIYHGEVTP